MMFSLSCSTSAYPAHSRQGASQATVPARYSSRLSAFINHHHPFVPEVVEAVNTLYTEFKAVDYLVACNTARILKAYQNAQLGYHVSKNFIRISHHHHHRCRQILISQMRLYINSILPFCAV